MATIVQRVIQRVGGGARPDDSLLLVVDDAGWILDEVAQRLAEHLPASLKCRIVSTEWRRAKRCTIHFIDRAWAWADDALDRVDDSNRLIGVWWHGQTDSQEPPVQAALRRLREQHHRFARIQVTCSVARRTLESLGVPADKIVTLPLGVDLKMFRPRADDAARLAARRALQLADDTTVIGCFQKDGNGWGEGLEPKLIKGPDVLADALIQLNASQRIHALIPGPARGYVASRLQAAGVPFSAPGMVPRTELPRLYHALDMYLSPSRDEGGPAGVLEAMASGVPVVSSRAGMPVDLIESGVNGVLVDVGDPAALAGAAAALVGNRAQGSAFANAALASIQPYDWPLVAARYAQELYCT